MIPTPKLEQYYFPNKRQLEKGLLGDFKTHPEIKKHTDQSIEILAKKIARVFGAPSGFSISALFSEKELYLEFDRRVHSLKETPDRRPLAIPIFEILTNQAIRI